MRDLLSWNLPVGRVAGAHVRLHVFFLLLLVFALAAREQVPLPYSLSGLGLLFLSVIWHELAHALVARRLHCLYEQVLLWPLGGMAGPQAQLEPQFDCVLASAGPIANLSVCVVLGPVLWLMGAGELMSLNPLRPPYAEFEPVSAMLVAQAFWINWMLVLVNLLPAAPLDGARMLRAMLWPRFGYRTAILQVAWVAKVTALVLLLVGWMESEAYPFAMIPLSLIAAMLYFSARQETERLQEQDADDGVFGYDFSQGYTSLERVFEPHARPKPGPLQRWLDTRRENKARRQREVEEQEDRRMDDILLRLHEVGPGGLSAEDRALLERVSARYRNRQRS